MTVNPGFGGQEFIRSTVGKVSRARHLLSHARSRARLQVDGGIARETIAEVWRAGADTFVAGNAVFSSKDPAAEIRALRELCTETV
jgi:ribulose-phosphate 3-epimerase